MCWAKLGEMSFVPGTNAPPAMSARPRWFLVHQAGLVVRAEDSGFTLPALSDVVDLGFDPKAAQYVGSLDGEDCFALHLESATVREPWTVQGLRGLFAALGEELFIVAGRALQLASFELTHRFCGGCGRPTRRVRGEHSVRCDFDDLSFYPRIAPAIIVLVRRGEQALLGRSSRFTSGMYSTLAGFVEPGESLEQTLAREVREEVGVEVTNIRYFGSQPWPFPHSLMVGFVADHAGGDIGVDGVEIVDARWFSVDDLPVIPPRPSIARKLIDAWVEEVTERRR
jgi:NAD+ diphosphatase